MKPLLLVVLIAVSFEVFAASTVEVHVFTDEALERRYYALIDELRCPKCQNTNLAGSDAPIAHDLRNTVYRLLIEEGRSDHEIRQFLVDRYGEFVLYDPPFNPYTALLWLLPLIALGIGVVMLRRFTRREVVLNLSPAEEAQLRVLRGDVALGASMGEAPKAYNPQSEEPKEKSV
ncbi:MAG: cytochrome c-type biogenesis protein CcmH [Gammaproteobacteria bacterium]|nr:cytochrome c-type biogenesis protein CcmH [Gammaproteobacteria bacterium]